MAVTIKDVARTAGVSTATVSAVINESAYVSPALRARVLEAVKGLGYAPSQLARRLRTGASDLIAIAVADLSNPFYARVVCAAEAAVGAWGFSLVVFNSDEKPEAEKRIISRVRTLCCEGLILVPVGGAVSALSDAESRRVPTVLFGRTLEGDGLDSVTIDNFAASYQATSYLIDLGHQRIGAITGPRHLSTGLSRIEGMQSAMSAKGLTVEPRFVRSGDFREEVAYSAARVVLEQPDRPTALYVANGLMALGVMRAIADVGLRCPEDVSVASTDNIPESGVSGPISPAPSTRSLTW
jgi:LacI family transcriptional regulator, galactose operon repressor